MIASVQNRTNRKVWKILSAIVTLMTPMFVQAQTIQSSSVYNDDKWQQEVEAFRANPQQLPRNGTLQLEGDGHHTITLRYKSNPNFVGTDTFRLRLLVPTMPSSWEEHVFVMNVQANLMTIVDDDIMVRQENSIRFSPLSNDVIQHGNLRLVAVPLVNNGTATVAGNDIVFVPNPNFSGLTHLNYLVCSDRNRCAVGLTTLYVTPQQLPDVDTIRVFTEKNTTAKFLLPEGFVLNQLVSAPQFGNLANPAPIFLFAPQPNFVGQDQFDFENSAGKKLHVKIEVYQKSTPPQYLRPDEAFLVPNGSVLIPILQNDNGTALRIQSVTTDTNGTSEIVNGTQIRFTPNPDFEGAAALTYRATQNGTPIEEVGKVRIMVSRFQPNSNLYRFNAYENTPLILNYAVPISDYSFLIHRAPLAGTLDYNQQNRQLIYTPDGSRPTDYFEVKYKVSGQEILIQTAINVSNMRPNCINDDCLWAGDANADGIVDMRDMFFIAENIGEKGVFQNNINAQWSPQNADNWVQNSSNGRNLKHADTNGDGIISAADTVAIAENYGKMRTYQSHSIPFPSNIPLRLVPQQSTMSAGDMVTFKLLLGDAQNPVFDVKGLGFILNYDATRWRDDWNIDFKEEYWLKFPSATLQMVQQPTDGRVEAGIAPSARSRGNGWGEVAVVRAIGEDVICCFAKDNSQKILKVKLQNAFLTDANGNLMALKVEDAEIPIVERPKNLPPSIRDLLVYPNPAKEELNIFLNGDDHELMQIRLFNILGNVVLEQKFAPETRQTKLSVGELTNGFYLLEAITFNGSKVVQKVEIFK